MLPQGVGCRKAKRMQNHSPGISKGTQRYRKELQVEG